MLVAISAAGVFRTDDGGKTWRAANRGLVSEGIPDPDAEVGHCVHKLARHPARPDVVYMQKHWDVMRTDDGGENWHDIGGNLPTDFGFVVDVHAHEPETVYVLPITSDTEHFPPEGKLRVYRSRTGGHEWEPLTTGLPQEHCYVDVLRDAMSVDGLDECGVYFGTTGGQVYASADAGDSWAPIVRDLPGGAVRGGADAAMTPVRVKLPTHLRRLADLDGEMRLDIEGPLTLGAVLDTLEANYPVLRGTVRDRATGQRRAFVRFFACEQDLSHEPPDAPLPGGGCSRCRTVTRRRSNGRRIAHGTGQRLLSPRRQPGQFARSQQTRG